LIELKGTDTVILHRDSSRELIHTDPYHRQIFIGLGCFIEQMVIAASADGFTVGLTLFPEGENGPVAIAKFDTGGQPDPLAAQILHRRSCKEAFASTSVEVQKVTALQYLANITTDKEKVTEIHNLIWDAFQVETYTPRTFKESVDLMRIGKSEINANPDGLSMGGSILDAARSLGLLTNEALLETDTSSFHNFMSDYEALLYSTPAFATITSPSNTRWDQVEAGRKWLRLNLKTTELGLSLHPVSQALQEYPEMSAHFSTAHRLLAKEGETVQMLGRLGYGPQTPRTPRWPLETRILNG
jgi:hypothetical protein